MARDRESSPESTPLQRARGQRSDDLHGAAPASAPSAATAETATETTAGRAGSTPQSTILHLQRTVGNQVARRYVQRLKGQSSEAQGGTDLSDRIQSASGSGQGLDPAVQDRLEAGYGADLSGVRVHTDGEADQLAQSVNAVAFTSGQDIFFRSGTYAPSTDAGSHLLAHETAHVVQQTNGAVAGTPVSGGVSISDPHDDYEEEAERAATQIQRTGQADLSGGRGGGGAGRAVQRNVVDDIVSGVKTLGHDVAEGIGLEDSFDANLGRADAFHDHGLYGPQDVTPGDSGGFEVSYDPAAGQMKIVMRVAVDFVDAISVSGATISPVHAYLQPVANQATALPAPARAAFIARYQWQAAEKDPWKTQLKTSVESAWAGKYQFHIRKPQWEWIGATVAMDIQVHEGARASNDHLAVESIKLPPGENLYTYGASSETGPGVGNNATDQTMTLASTDVAGRPDNTLKPGGGRVLFAHDSDALDGTATGYLDSWIKTFQGAPANPASNPTKIVLEAHTSAPGSATYNEGLAQRRADAVKNYLNTHGFTNVSTRVTVDNKGEAGTTDADTAAQQADQRRVDLIVDGGGAQVLAAHEFGHAFGLGDEYATGAGSLITGTGATAGTPASHDKQVKDMQDASGVNLPGAIHENNANIMSLGNAVRPQHYATFHTALVEVTGESEWALGPPGPRPTRPAPGSPAPGTPPPAGP